MAFWGHVLEEAQAKHISKNTTIHLGYGANHFGLVLDGSKNSALSKSNVCLAFHVPPVPPQKASEEVSAVAVGNSCDKTAGSVAAGPDASVPDGAEEPAAKKPKLVPQVATHKIIYEEFTITDAAGTSHVYQTPYLVDAEGEIAHACDVKLHRSATLWDTVKPPPKQSASKKADFMAR